MSEYEYTYDDTSDGRLEIRGARYGAIVESSGVDPAVYVRAEDAPAVALELLKAAGQDSVIVPKSKVEVVDAGLGAARCGRDDEMAIAYLRQAPATLRARAANFIALAEHIESAAREAAEKAEAGAAEKKLADRRDAIATDLDMTHYVHLVTSAALAVDRIIELEDMLAAK